MRNTLTLASFVALCATVALCPTDALRAQQRADAPVRLPEREPGNPATGPFDPLVFWSGPDSQITERRFERVMSDDAWQKLWEAHTGKPVEIRNTGGPAMPQVNFDKCMVVAVCQGKSWNSNGVYCAQVIDEPERIVFRFDERSFQTFGPGGGGVAVKPYGFFVLPRSTKAIVIEDNVQNLKDEPQKWKQRASFDAIKP